MENNYDFKEEILYKVNKRKKMKRIKPSSKSLTKNLLKIINLILKSFIMM